MIETPAEHCGDQPPRYSDHTPPTECVLRPGHSGSHAGEHGARWWQITPAEGADDQCVQLANLTARIGHPVRCPHCGPDAEPIPPTHWTKHVQRHHPDAPAPDPVQAAGGEVGPTPAGTVDNADAVRDHELQRLREQIAEALLPVMSSSWQDEGLARRFADAVLAVRDEELQQLRDELAALTAISRGYCPHCGRGDCAPTADQWLEQRQRADRAEAALERVRDAATLHRQGLIRLSELHAVIGPALDPKETP